VKWGQGLRKNVIPTRSPSDDRTGQVNLFPGYRFRSDQVTTTSYILLLHRPIFCCYDRVSYTLNSPLPSASHNRSSATKSAAVLSKCHTTRSRSHCRQDLFFKTSNPLPFYKYCEFLLKRSTLLPSHRHQTSAIIKWFLSATTNFHLQHSQHYQQLQLQQILLHSLQHPQILLHS